MIPRRSCIRTLLMLAWISLVGACEAKTDEERSAVLEKNRPAADERSDDQAAPTEAERCAEQVEALAREFLEAQAEYYTRYRQADSDEKRSAIKKKRPALTFAGRFLNLARACAEEPAAVDAVVWVLDFARRGLSGSEVDEALDLIARHHLESENIAALCRHPRIYAIVPRGEALLRAVIENNPHRRVKGQTCFALATRLSQRGSHRINVYLKRADEEDIRGLEELYGREVVEQLERSAAGQLSGEVEALYERIVADYADVEDRHHGGYGIPGVGFDDLDAAIRSLPPGYFQPLRSWVRGTLGEAVEREREAAERKRFALRRLAIGKVAPDIEGEDIDGEKLELSDFRGKVVVLNFWGHWCGPCRDMYPHERSLVKRLQDKPFALLGINSDRDRDELKKTIETEQITWRSWWDGGSPSGPIATKWNVSSLPTIYVLDHRGVIRYKGVRGEAMGKAIDTLLAELEAEKTGK